jgi:hypothetical protein
MIDVSVAAMRFEPAKLSGAYIVETELHEDARGFFARIFCAREFTERGPALVSVTRSQDFEYGYRFLETIIGACLRPLSCFILNED